MGVSTKSETQISLVFVAVALDDSLLLLADSIKVYLSIQKHIKPKPNKIKEKRKSRKNKRYLRCLHQTKLRIISHLTTSPQFFTKTG